MIVFYHNDADGRCAAALIGKWRSWDKNMPLPQFIEMDYKTPLPIHELNPLDDVAIVDFSFKPDDMRQIIERSASVIWCDHHATAKDYGYDAVAGFRDFSNKGLAGCECTFRHFWPEKPIDPFIRLLGDYDAWRLQEQPACFEFYEGLKLENQNPADINSVWYELLDWHDDVYHAAFSRIMTNGKAAIKYRDNYCSEMIQSFGYETSIDGVKAYAANLYRFGSCGFGEKFQQYPICLAYAHDGKKFIVSLYSETVDVSAIAKKFGGGGHKGAAGFVCEALPWT